MDELLKIYLPMNKTQKKEVWDKGIIVFDTNVLLNLYKYSNETRQEFLSIMERAKDRLWLPHQVALEFLLNRKERIKDQELDYDNHIKAIKDAKEAALEKIDKSLNGIKKPFRKTDLGELKGQLQTFFDELAEKLKNENKDKPDFNKDDLVLKKFKSFYFSNISDGFSNDELDDIYEKGKERYLREQPPGYADWKSKEGEHKYFRDTCIKSEYGDLILWMQTIQKAKEDNIHVVFVTDDSKEDWWKEYKGIKTPRPELINEFKTETGNEILIYNSEQFLKNANLITDQNPKASVIEEIQRFSKRNERRLNYFKQKELLHKDNDYTEFILKNNSLKDKERSYDMDLNEKKITAIKREIKFLERELNFLRVKVKNQGYDNDSSEKNSEDIQEFKAQIRMIEYKLDELNTEYIRLLKRENELLSILGPFKKGKEDY